MAFIHTRYLRESLKIMSKIARISLLLSGFTALLGLGIISSFLTTYSESLGATGLWIGIIFSGFVVARSLSNYFVSNIFNKYGKKIFITSGLLIFAIASFLFTLPLSKIELSLLRLIQGFGSGMILPGVYSYSGIIKSDNSKIVSARLFNLFYYGALATGPILGAILFTYFGYNFVFHFIALFAFIVFIICLIFLPRLKTLNSIPENTISFRKLIRHNIVKAIILTAFLRAIRSSVLMSFITVLIFVLDKENTLQVGIIISFGLFVTAVFQFLITKFTERSGHFRSLIQIFAGTLIGSAGLLLAPDNIGFSKLLYLSCLIGLGAALSLPATTNIGNIISMKIGTWYWMKLINRVNSIGFIVGPLLSGLIFEIWNIKMVFYILAAFSFLTAIIFSFMVLKKEAL